MPRSQWRTVALRANPLEGTRARGVRISQAIVVHRRQVAGRSECEGEIAGINLIPHAPVRERGNGCGWARWGYGFMGLWVQ